ncbi:MAG: hypothetical protein WDZ51_04785 [Pirellulaceae bacterium]
MPRLPQSRLTLMLLAVVIAGLTTRVVWHASTTETGWQTLARQVRGSVLVWFEYPPVNVGYRSWADQADFWLDVSDRVQGRYPEDPAMLMMAAQTMREHSIFANSIELRLGYGVPGPTMDLNYLSHHQGNAGVPPGEEFHQKCRQRRLELALRAAECEPENLIWWRMVAWLIRPDHPEWETVLQQCAAHDPENAYYDYLAAIFYWNQGGSYSSRGQQGRKLDFATGLSIHDADRFQKGVEAFERGLAKPLLNSGEWDQVREFNRGEIYRFINAAGLTIDERPMDFEVSVGQGIRQNPWRVPIVTEILRWQSARAFQLATAEQTEAALEQLRQADRLLEQLNHEGPYPESSHDWGPIQQFVPFVRYEVARRPEVTIDKERRDRFALEARQAEQAYQLWFGTLKEDRNRQEATGPQWPEPLHERYPWINILVGILPSLIPPLLLFALVTAALARGSGGNILAGPAWWLRGVLFLLCLTLSLVLFGLAPAAVLPPIITAWILSLTVIFSPLIVLTVLAVRSFRGGAKLTDLFVSIAICGAIFWLFRFTRMNVADANRTFPFYLEIPQNVFWLRRSEVPFGTLWLVAIEWTVYQGPWLAIAAWLAILAAWQLRPEAWRTSTVTQPPSWRDRFASVSWPLATSSLALGAVLMAIYLSLAPAIIHDVESVYQFQTGPLDDPAQYMADREAEFQAIKQKILQAGA